MNITYCSFYFVLQRDSSHYGTNKCILLQNCYICLVYGMFCIVCRFRICFTWIRYKAENVKWKISSYRAVLYARTIKNTSMLFGAYLPCIIFNVKLYETLKTNKNVSFILFAFQKHCLVASFVREKTGAEWLQFSGRR